MASEADAGSGLGTCCGGGIVAALKGDKANANPITAEICRATIEKLVLSNQAVNDSVAYKDELVQLSAQHAKIRGPVNQAVAFLLQARADNPISNYESEARAAK